MCLSVIYLAVPPLETMLEAVLRGEGFTVSSKFLQKVQECFVHLTCLRPDGYFPSIIRCVGRKSLWKSSGVSCLELSVSGRGAGRKVHVVLSSG